MSWYERLISRDVANIDPMEAYRRMQADPAVVMVDVRQPFETASGIAPGAVLIPMTELGRRLDELPKDRPILTICRSSHRSPIVARQLQRAGYNVVNVSGGMLEWQAVGLPVVVPGN